MAITGKITDRFTGRVEPLIGVEVRSLIDWLDTVYKPQDWHKGPDRPFVRVDPQWEGFAVRTAPVVSEVLSLFPGCTDTYRALTVLHAGDYVPDHTDTQSPEWISRIHVPLVTNPGAFLIVETIHYQLEVGMAYQVNPGRLHAVTNGGAESRIHLMFDVVKG